MALAPTPSLDPFTVSFATAAAIVAVPSTAGPKEKVTVPVGTVVPDAAFTVAVSTVEALWTILAGLAVTTILVAAPGGATVTVTGLAVELLKAVLPVYVATTVLAPVTRLLPGTIKAAVATPPEPDNAAVPSKLLPAENVTFPAGVPLPLAGFTVTVICVVPAAVILAGLATAVVVVLAGGVRITPTEPVELPKFPVAV